MMPKYSKRTVDEAVRLLEPECPGEDCPMCTGEMCNKCGAGCWNNSARNCEHDGQDRHVDPEYTAEAAQRLREGWRL